MGKSGSEEFLSSDEVHFSKLVYDQSPKNILPRVFQKMAEATFTKLEERNPNRSFDEINNIKSSLFEIRVGCELQASEKCQKLEYEFCAGLGNTTIDYKFNDLEENTWLLELTSVRVAKQVLENTLEENGIWEYSSSDDVQDLLKIQGILNSKVWDAKNSKALKFPNPASNSFHVLMVDVRNSILGMLDKNDCLLLTYGSDAVGGPYKRNFKGEPVSGIFQENHPDAAELKTFREGVHFLTFVKEKDYNLAIKKQNFTLYNPGLFKDQKAAKEVWKNFPLACLKKNNEQV